MKLIRILLTIAIILFITLTVWSILYDKAVIPHNDATSVIDKIVGYTYIFRQDSGMRKWMLKSTNDIIGLFGGNKN